MSKMTNEPKEKFKPGSEEAIDAGCRCPVIDNSYGKGSGFVDDEGKPTYWISELCEYHKEN